MGTATHDPGAGAWYVSFHGGEGDRARNNLHRYANDGAHLGKALRGRGLPRGLKLRELRGFVLGPDGDLYVANAYRDESQILRFRGRPDPDGRHPFREVFVRQRHADHGLAHPFSATFGPGGHLFVPSQDSDIVGRYYGPRTAGPDAAAIPGRPMPHPAALSGIDADRLAPGTFVPSVRRAADGLRAVRHAIFADGDDLFVADRAENAVKRYDRESGALKRTYRHRLLQAPVHLLRWPERGALLVGSRDRDAVVALDLEQGDARDVVAPGAGGLAAPSGIAWGPDGLLVVGSRGNRAVLRFDPESGRTAAPLLTALPDHPEFVRWLSPPAGR